MKRRTRKRTLLASLIAVNAAFVGTSSVAVASPQEESLRDACYKLTGIAFFEKNVFLEISKDENGFNVKVNEEEWEQLDDETRDALKGCLDLFIEVQDEQEL